MLISLHSQATTTPRIRAAIQACDEPVWVLAERYGISEQTVWRWRKRDGVHDLSHTPHRLQTTLTPAQEAVAVALRTTLLLPLDDLLAVLREFLNPNVSLGSGPMPAAAWAVPAERSETEGAEACAQDLQGIRTRLPACRREVPAADGRRGAPPLPLRGDRPRHPLGFR